MHKKSIHTFPWQICSHSWEYWHFIYIPNKGLGCPKLQKIKGADVPGTPYQSDWWLQNYQYATREDLGRRVIIRILIYYLYIIVFLIYRGFWVSFAQGGTGVPCTPFSVFLDPFLSHMPALPVVVGGGGRVYAWVWGVLGDGLLLWSLACLPE